MAIDEATVPKPDATKPTKPKKPKRTFMLHDPKDMSCISKFKATEERYAALKAASQGHTDILLRATNTKQIRQYTGSYVTLDTPKEVRRGNDPTKPPIRYTREPRVVFVKKWTYEGKLPALDDDDAAARPPGSVPLADVK